MDDLDAALANALIAPGRGKRRPAADSASLTFIRKLGEPDMQKLGAPPAEGAGQVMRAVKTRHHALAMLLADGTSNVEAGAITGYDAAYISVLRGDPTFQELIAHYQSNKKEVYLSVHQRLAMLGIQAANELLQRLEDAPEKVSTKDVREILQSALDRSGLVKDTGPNAPKAGPTVTVKFVTAQPVGEIIDVTPARESQ